MTLLEPRQKVSLREMGDTVNIKLKANWPDFCVYAALLLSSTHRAELFVGLFCVYVCALHVCLVFPEANYQVPWNYQELELYIIVSRHVGPRNQACFSVRPVSTLNHCTGSCMAAPPG